MEVYVETLCFFTQPKEGFTTNLTTKTNQNNQTSWNSDSQGDKETFVLSDRMVGGVQPGGEDAEQGGGHVAMAEAGGPGAHKPGGTMGVK